MLIARRVSAWGKDMFELWRKAILFYVGIVSLSMEKIESFFNGLVH